MRAERHNNRRSRRTATVSKQAMGSALLLALLGVLGPAFAQVQPGITANVNNTSVVVDELFMLTLELQGSEIGDVLLPETPDVGFKPVPSFQASSHSITWERGQERRITTRQLGYETWAKRQGQVTIPPVRALIDGQEYQTLPIVLTVRAKGTAPPRPSPRGSAQQPSRTSTSSPSMEETVLLESEVDKSEVYQGEPIMLTMRILQLASPNVVLTGRPRIETPSTEGFFAGPLTQYPGQEMRNGWPYQVTELRQALFPTGVGEYMIGRAQWVAQVRAITQVGLRTDVRDLSTDPIPIQVKPLPERPPNFSGAVGQFDVSAGIKDQRLIQGVPTTFEFSVFGRGNPNAIVPPQYPDLDWAQISGPEVETQHDEQDWPLVRKTFTFTITPLKAGEFSLPSFDFVFFHPPSGSFKSDTVPELPVQVEASPEGEQLVVMGGRQTAQQQEVRILSEDLVPILTQPEHLDSRRSPVGQALGWAITPPLLYGGFFLYLRRRRRFTGDPELARRHFAAAKARKRLGHLDQSAEPSEDLYRAVMGYVADKFNVSETGMTSQDAEYLLERHDVTPELRAQFMKVLRACERRRYAALELRREELHALAEGAEAAIRRLETGTA